MLQYFKGRQKYDAGVAPHKSDRRLQDRQQMEDTKRERGGIYTVWVKKYEKEFGCSFSYFIN